MGVIELIVILLVSAFVYGMAVCVTLGALPRYAVRDGFRLVTLDRKTLIQDPSSYLSPLIGLPLCALGGFVAYAFWNTFVRQNIELWGWLILPGLFYVAAIAPILWGLHIGFGRAKILIDSETHRLVATFCLTSIPIIYKTIPLEAFVAVDIATETRGKARSLYWVIRLRQSSKRFELAALTDASEARSLATRVASILNVPLS